MAISTPFIHRPVATTLLSIGLCLLGILAFNLLPVASLPRVDYPTISVSAKQAGASPEVMAATVATPLERTLGRLAGVNEITSTSSLGSTNITLQFDLSRDINGAARDVQGAINASLSSLPSGLQNNPTYRKVNPADAPVMILALTSKTLSRGQMYDAADTILGQKLLQIDGVGDVSIGGAAQPAVRVELNPLQLAHYGVGLETVRSAITATNANRPKGFVEQKDQLWEVQANDQAKKAQDYLPLIISYKDNSPVRISDVAAVKDSVLDTRNAGYYSEQPSVLILVFKQPNANVIETIQRVKDMLPTLQSALPTQINIQVAVDRSTTIKASLREIEMTMIISVILVILVVFVFLRNGRATLIPALTVPISLIGTFALMYLSGFSLNNISLMALTVATGFVVDDTIVVLETISRRLEEGLSPMQAAITGAKEVSFTVISMSISLIAVFVPILLMGGIVGRLFHEFAMTLSYAILISMLVSLTTTPMLCAWWLKSHPRQSSSAQLEPEHFPISDSEALRLASEDDYIKQQGLFGRITLMYKWSLAVALRFKALTLIIFLFTIAFNVYLYVVIPKGFFPQQDTGVLRGSLRADQNISFNAMNLKLKQFINVIEKDPAVDHVMGTLGGAQINNANLFLALKPLGERTDTPTQVMGRLRKNLAHEPGATLVLTPVQDIQIGGRLSDAGYQYTLQSDDLNSLRTWTPRLKEAFNKLPALTDVTSDQEVKGLKTALQFDHDKMTQLGVTQAQVDSVLNDAFGQRQVSTIYNAMNQYHVVMEIAPEFAQSVESLRNIYIQSSSGGAVPLSAFSTWQPENTSLSVNHQGLFAASTLSFNLNNGYSLSDATDQINQVMNQLQVPSSIHGNFQGSAKAFQSSLSSQPLLILAAIIVIYIVLGILYESFAHPITILSTLPSAGLGALIALMLFQMEFNVIALIGILLLVGIVKKNAIMMIDVALTLQRQQNLPAEQAILNASVLRFRPIMMTTLTALFGVLPLALGRGNGAELHVPLGISIVGGLIISQILTLYTTPVMYLYIDRLSQWGKEKFEKFPSFKHINVKK
ncbi:efflux RND transporter permease subunit [Acinetobacter sp. ANC 4648]|uniref:efflux RND transporter permease subunit n=1 Tax=Acinetobacter sp. ANC 4648 TaxID=1977875 RepID=UPI000A344321|nr:efflux RND transporter permease subunit [Acinetobacter sp. ANC 4648]OTG82957.1 multidrug transporter subunit MdtC [Acinetobacter sp. ANC 4648]